MEAEQWHDPPRTAAPAAPGIEKAQAERAGATAPDNAPKPIPAKPPRDLPPRQVFTDFASI